MTSSAGRDRKGQRLPPGQPTSTATAGSTSPSGPPGSRRTPEDRRDAPGAHPDRSPRGGQWRVDPPRLGADPAPHPVRRRAGHRQGRNWSWPRSRGEGPRGRTGEWVMAVGSWSARSPIDPFADRSGPTEVADDSLHTVHNLQLIDLDGDRRDRGRARRLGRACSSSSGIRKGSGLGRSSGSGNQDSSLPNKGASEVKVGKLRGRKALRGDDRTLARVPGRRLHPAEVRRWSPGIAG